MRRQAGDVPLAEPHAAAADRRQPGDCLDKGRLPRAIRSKQGDDLAGVCMDGRPVDDRELRLVAGNEVFDDEQRLAAHHADAPPR